ncbi:MAG TPA: sigma-70 family RNA polymerase sigma factor [Candidatus Saccharimonadales bacterium]|jgi:RNA polymerase sigma-70 factor (ECF subfamily)|nr:sigma-70 family RNA polymerase sigma factor [Candidatus Saccharimonadales bacterium]
MRLRPGKHLPQRAINFSEYVDGLYGYALILSRNRTDAEDLVQETCLRAIPAMERLLPDSNIKSWLFTILRNIWLNEVRRLRAAPETVELDRNEETANTVVDSGKDPHAVYVSNFEREQVRNAIQQLPSEFREIVLLREYEELSYEQLAALLECPVGTVMSRLARARAKLRDLLPAGALAPRSQKKVAGDAEGTLA